MYTIRDYLDKRVVHSTCRHIFERDYSHLLLVGCEFVRLLVDEILLSSSSPLLVASVENFPESICGLSV